MRQSSDFSYSYSSVVEYIELICESLYIIIRLIIINNMLTSSIVFQHFGANYSDFLLPRMEKLDKVIRYFILVCITKLGRHFEH